MTQVEGGNLMEMKQFLNKQVKIILDDGARFPTKKEGLLVGVTKNHLILKINSHKEAILIARAIRIEILD